MKAPILAGVLAIVLMGCGPRIPPRPAGVPEGAFWAGDAKGGVFVVFVTPDHDGWQVKLFNDHSGAIVGQGLYVLHYSVGRSAFQQEDFANWDGRAVHLKDGGILEPKNR